MSFLAISALKSTSAYERGWVILGAPSSWSLGTEGLAAAEILKPSRVVEALTSKTRSSAEEVLRSVRVFKVTFIVSRERLSVVAKRGGRVREAAGVKSRVDRRRRVSRRRRHQRHRLVSHDTSRARRGRGRVGCASAGKRLAATRSRPNTGKRGGAAYLAYLRRRGRRWFGQALRWGECRSDTACANSDEAIFTEVG